MRNRWNGQTLGHGDKNHNSWSMSESIQLHKYIFTNKVLLSFIDITHIHLINLKGSNSYDLYKEIKISLIVEHKNENKK